MTSGSTGDGVPPAFAARRILPALIAWRRPSPSSSPGILRSLTTMSIGWLRSCSSASLPVCASLTSWPARRRQMPRNSRIDCSSSTTRIFPTRGLWHGRRYHRSPAWTVIVGLCALVVYAALASPYVVAADNAEFAALGALGGGAHPSGYPLYVLWLRAWSWLPGATAAHTAALATAILGGLSIAVLHAACRA